jgi:hypothetical protein
MNPSPLAGAILEGNLDKVDWRKACFSDTPVNMRILERRLETHGLNQINIRIIVTRRNISDEAIRLIRRLFELDAFGVTDELVYLSQNNRALEIFKGYEDKIDWRSLSAVPSAIPLLRENLDKVCWVRLSRNGAATPLLRENIEKVNWSLHSEFAEDVSLLSEEGNLERVNWSRLSENPFAISLLKKNVDRINWYSLCKNPSPECIPLLVEYIQSRDVRIGTGLRYYIRDGVDGYQRDVLNWVALMQRPEFPCEVLRERVLLMTKEEFESSNVDMILCCSKNPGIFEEPPIYFLK